MIDRALHCLAVALIVCVGVGNRVQAQTTALNTAGMDQPKPLVTYDIKRSRYKGLEVFDLTGGMSAEFAVQKSLTSLTCGISHMWHPANAAGGPTPVMATPEFLPRSLRRTVDLYNGVIGEKTKVKTVIIGSGVPSVSYLTTTMSAVYLPMHFLAAAHTAGGFQEVLNRANSSDYPSYATLGYDGSMPGVGVAWIKLLDLPPEYREFLIDHQVEEVILYGVGEKVLGESYARKVVTATATKEYGPGSLYVQYTGYGSEGDKKALGERIGDFTSLKLADSQLIADWESGIISDQIANFSRSIKIATKAKPYSIVAEGDMIHLYDMAPGLMTAYIKKNEERLKPPFIKGVAFNEYLVCHPQYEAYSGYVPLLYWQFVPAESTVERCFGTVKQALGKDYPEIAARGSSLRLFLNSNYGRENLKAALISKGVPPGSITLRGQGGDVWNPADGMNAPCEKFADAIVNDIGVAKYVATMTSLLPLTMADIHSICERNGGLAFVER